MFKKDLRKSNSDSAWKDILDVYFKECMEFFYPEIAKKIDWLQPYEALDKELQSIARNTKADKYFVDKLLKVKSFAGHDQIILTHVEVQGRKEDVYRSYLKMRIF